jgi:hypothetical protein
VAVIRSMAAASVFEQKAAKRTKRMTRWVLM